MNLELLTFLLYVIFATSTTVFVGWVLYKNGAVFLRRIFQSIPHVVEPVNKLLLLGFYLINIGFVLVFFTQQSTAIQTALDVLDFLSCKLGTVYLILGGMHLFNLLIFMVIEKRLSSSTMAILSNPDT